MAPCFALCTDGIHAAVLDGGRLTLYVLDGGDLGRPVAAADAVGDRVAACGAHLLVHAHDALASLVTLYDVPSLTALSALELAAPTRLLATSGAYALVDRGDQAFVISATGGALAAVPLRPPASFTRAVGLDGAQFLTFGARGTERWSATERRPSARLGLVLPDDVDAIGLALRGSSLWMASDQPALHLARLSDGRITTLRLPAPPRNVLGHPGTAWLLAELDGVPHAINTAIRQLETIDPGAGELLGVVPGRDRDADARLVVRLGDRVVATSLTGGGRPVMPVADEDAPSPPLAPPPPRQEPTTIGVPPPMALPATIRHPARPAIERPPPHPGRAATWRDELLVWARTAAGVAGPVPPLADSALATLADRAALSMAAWPVVAALYAAWLDGDAGAGTPSAHLAAMAGSDAWTEAVGAGVVAQLGLATWHRGRASLADAVGEFLDGQPARALALFGDAPRPVPPGIHRLPRTTVEPMAAVVERAVAAAGQVATVIGDARAQAGLEAWLRGVPLVLDGEPAVTARPGATIYLADPR
ncbi:MAG: hypothetical protein R3B06_16790 [Kofleriaceae bacterium]